MQVGVNLGKPGYLEKIADATKDVDVQLLFCNAGYMLTGFFESTWGCFTSVSITSLAACLHACLACSARAGHGRPSTLDSGAPYSGRQIMTQYYCADRWSSSWPTWSATQCALSPSRTTSWRSWCASTLRSIQGVSLVPMSNHEAHSVCCLMLPLQACAVAAIAAA